MQHTIDIRDHIGKRSVASANDGVVRNRTSLFKSRIREIDVSDFCTQLSVMLSARVALHKALEVIVVQTDNERLREIVAMAHSDVLKGSSFWKALGRHPEAFDDLIVVTVEVGEESGMLAEVLTNLANHLEKMAALRKKVMQALTYPLLVILVAATAVGFLLVFVVPTFAEMFRSYQMELPWSTNLVLGISNAVTAYGSFMILGFVLAGIGLRQPFRNLQTKAYLESLAMKLPVVGGIMVKNHMARFCRTLGTQLQAQVSLLDALGTTKRIMKNTLITREIEGIIANVRKGNTVASPVKESKVFPPMVAQMISVGEETSKLDTMLMKVAVYYEKEIDGRVQQLSAVIEPTIVLLLGLVVGAILIAMYLPMFDLVNVIGE